MDPILLDAIEYNGGGISQLLNKGAVKSVQRGYAEFGYDETTSGSGSIPISAVDASKCLLTIRDASATDGTINIENFVKYTLSSSAISYTVAKAQYGRITDLFVDWQVIEFY